MKHSLWICLLLTLLVSGCTREEMLRNGTSASGGRIFTTSFENNESRTYLEDGHLSRWTEGDRISLFDANTLNNQYLFGGKTGDTGGSFFMLSKPEGTGSSLAANYAVYPYSEDVVMIREGEISVILPSEQHYAENSYGLGDNTMVAVTEDTEDTFLSFKNVGGVFKLQLYGDDVNVQSISLMGNNGEKIAGNATITVAYNETPVVAMADDATNTITLDCGERGVKIGASADKATAFCMVVPPVTFEKGITIIIMDINGKSFTQTTDKKIVIERNVVKPMVAIKADVTYERVIPEELKDSCLVTNIQVDGADAAKFYEGCFVSSIYDKMPISDGTLELQTNINKKVQTYWLTGKNDEIYMMTRVTNTEKNKSIEFNAEKTAMAFVTFHPFFANIDSLAYDVLEETILQCQNFPKLQAEVKNVIRQKQDLFDQNNTVLFDALGALLEEIMVFTTDDPESQAVSRAITNNTQYFPIRINSSGRRMEFQVFGLNPNYYGTATHANGDVENLVVESDDDFGFLSGLEIINDVLMKKGWTASQYGRKTRYYFPEEGECKFHFSCRTEENQVDLTMRILNSCMDILGGAISNYYSTYFRSKLKEIAFKNSGKVMAYFPYFSAARYASTGELWSLGYEMLKSMIDFAFDSEIERYKNLRYEWRYSSRRVKYYNNSLANLRSSKALFNKVMLHYTCAKSLVNIAARLINAGLAPDNIDFSYCYYNDEIYTCSRLRKYKGDGQTGNYGETLDIPISVMVNVDLEHESLSDYIVRFEVTNGGGAVKNEYVEIKDYQASTEWTLGYSSENQSVMAYLCDKETKTEVCEPVEFTAKAEGDPLREALIKLYESTNGDNWKRNDNWCSDKPITEWYGVWAASQEVHLNLYDNNLTGYIKQTFPDDVRIYLQCYNNQLTSLDVSGCTSLESLSCLNNQLTSLDVSGCTALTRLSCENNQLTSLDVSGCSALTFLSCGNDQLTSLDVSGCSALTTLWCHNNQLTSLDVSGCSALNYLRCENNQLTSLDVSGCSALTSLHCYGNQLTSLDVSCYSALTSLHCYNNQLTFLIASGCTALETLNCDNNQLISLIVSGCTALENLSCNNNQLTSLYVSGCTALEKLYCNNNNITSVIPGWFSQLSSFNYDVRFRYWTESVSDGKGGYKLVTRHYDRKKGWWYPGEPEKGEHSPN